MSSRLKLIQRKTVSALLAASPPESWLLHRQCRYRGLFERLPQKLAKQQQWQ
jgi:hypothetical protein